jgi:23S rRNA pseudouridine1911/1915/1917 synthase
MAPLVPIILFEDTHLLVLDKPAGLLSQGEHTGDENLVDWLRQYLGRPYVGLIHRLDRNTSGIMVVAKRTKSAQRLTASLQAGKIDRSYLAWVEGHMPPGPHRWKHFLLKDTDRNQVQVVPAGRTGGKEAILTAQAKGHGTWQGAQLTLAEFRLETGRSHQIRAQAAHEGFPLLGDRKYGVRQARADFGRPALHSHHLRFEHPMSHEWVEFEAPLPADMAAIPLEK